MKKFLLLLPLLLIAGCSEPERSPELVLPAFWEKANAWVQSGEEEDADAACSFISERVIRAYRETPDACLALLEEMLPLDRTLSVEAIRNTEKVPVGGGVVWVQPMLVTYRSGKEKKVVQTESAAPLLRGDDWAIGGLQGMKLDVMTIQEGLFRPRDAAALALLGSR